MKTECKIVIIGGSAGSFTVVRKIISSLPGNYGIPVVLCLHRLRDVRHGFVESLRSSSGPQVIEPLDKEAILPGNIYLCPSNYHLYIEMEGTFALSVDEAENYSRPSINVTFSSAANVFGKSMVGILLSGANSDGAGGICYSGRCGAYTIVQDPDEALFDIMPGKALALCKPDEVLDTDNIITYLKRLTGN
ncbi:MAG TPA: chemotaxis protein CheB [Bacteroidales bacterium]|nr:chemotaxis protein CheB [Bacteroidales bacterium]